MPLGDNKVLNGPEGEITMAFNQPTAMTQETSKVVTGSGSHPRPPPHPQQHPPLQRVDSRAYLQQQQHPQLQHPQYQQQPRPPGFRPPIGGRPLQFPPSGNPQFRPPLPVRPLRPPQLRPGAPRPPPPRPQFFAPSSRQSSVEESTRTLDPERSDDTLPPEERPPMKGRSFSLCSNPELPAHLDNTRRQSVSSIGSVEDVSGRRMDELPPSRPDSRAQQHIMSKIEENEEKAASATPPQAPATAAASTPPTTLPLATSDAKQSNSPSPQQPDSVIENKPPRSVPPIEITEKEKSEPTSNHQTPPSVAPSPSPSNLSPPKKEGDNDSGVDESTQGNDQSTNGEHPSPRKTARNTSRLTTPTKNRSFSRGSRSPNLKSPDSTPSTPGASEKKKLPMNKIQVGSAPSPNLKVVKSKIGSLANTSYKPGGGNVKIEHKKIDLSSAQSKIGAKNENYVPSGGDKKILSQKLQWSAKSKIGSLENTTHKPKGGDKKIESIKLDFKDKAKPKVGSKDNLKHVPGGGDIKIETKKLQLKVESKIGSLDNVKHKPGGGDKKIFDDKEYLRQMSGLSNEEAGSQNSLPSQPSDAREPVSDENLNREN